LGAVPIGHARKETRSTTDGGLEYDHDTAWERGISDLQLVEAYPSTAGMANQVGIGGQ
jgi:hypothetical protein